MQNNELSEKYVEYAEMLNELTTNELKVQNIRRLVDELKGKIASSENGDSCGMELSAHAFKQLSERLEKLSMENNNIYNDVFNKPNKSECLLLPSNLKCFIITLISDAHKKGEYQKESSKNTPGGFEYRFTINIKKWGTEDKELHLVCIIENYTIKTGYFNWI